MHTVNATTLKNRLGDILARAALGPVAIERHGRVVAYLVPPHERKLTAKPRSRKRAPGLRREEEERLLELVAKGDFRPSRWLRAGDPRLLAGLATMLASVDGFDRPRLLRLAETLQPGMSKAEEFGRWLETAPLQAARFLPMVRSRLKGAGSTPRR